MMIEKLKEHDVIDPKTDKVIGKIGCDLREIMDKLNELVDVINELQENQNTYWTDIAEIKKELQTRAENVQPDTESRQENVQDKFAEQRRWIGKLCRCWDSNINDDIWGILQDIKDNKTEKYYLYGIGYEHCKPVKPDDDIIYKGEQ